MSEADVLQKTRDFVAETFLYMRPGATVADDAPLLASGIIDSLGVMELVGFVEQSFGLTIAPEDITEDNFGSLKGIARYVVSRGA
jgi:acyl carrier protein